MRLVEFAVAVLIVAAMVWAVMQLLRSPGTQDDRWRLHERSEGEHVVVELAKAGSNPLRVGTAAVADEDFEDQLALLRAQAESKAAALNAGRRLPR